MVQVTHSKPVAGGGGVGLDSNVARPGIDLEDAGRILVPSQGVAHLAVLVHLQRPITRTMTPRHIHQEALFTFLCMFPTDTRESSVS